MKPEKYWAIYLLWDKKWKLLPFTIRHTRRESIDRYGKRMFVRESKNGAAKAVRVNVVCNEDAKK